MLRSSRKSELQTEVKRLDQECEKKRLELQEHTERGLEKWKSRSLKRIQRVSLGV